jgi:hypothetical protein
MKYKWHWGVAIAIVYAGFALIRIITIIISEYNDVDLVAPNYYEREIKYEERIQEVRNAKSLSVPVSVKTENRTVTITFPKQFQNDLLRGNITLFRPSNKRMDTTISLNPDSNSVQSIQLHSLNRGYWKIQLSWEYETKKYYEEYPLILQ